MCKDSKIVFKGVCESAWTMQQQSDENESKSATLKMYQIFYNILLHVLNWRLIYIQYLSIPCDAYFVQFFCTSLNSNTYGTKYLIKKYEWILDWETTARQVFDNLGNFCLVGDVIDQPILIYYYRVHSKT